MNLMRESTVGRDRRCRSLGAQCGEAGLRQCHESAVRILVNVGLQLTRVLALAHTFPEDDLVAIRRIGAQGGWLGNRGRGSARSRASRRLDDFLDNGAHLLLSRLLERALAA